jgi:membrane-associated phospholipid phosphatase
VAVALAAACAVTVWRVPIEDLLYGGEEAIDGLTAGYGGFGLGDAAGAALWAAALWFVTPLQLLLLFLGKIETERPSDEIISLLGRAAGLE